MVNIPWFQFYGSELKKFGWENRLSSKGESLFPWGRRSCSASLKCPASECQANRLLQPCQRHPCYWHVHTGVCTPNSHRQTDRQTDMEHELAKSCEEEPLKSSCHCGVMKLWLGPWVFPCLFFLTYLFSMPRAIRIANEQREESRRWVSARVRLRVYLPRLEGSPSFI